MDSQLVIRKEVVPKFVQLVKNKLSIRQTTYKLLTEAVLESISELLDDVKNNFNFGFSYDESEIEHFKTHLIDIMLLNIDLLPGVFSLHTEPELIKALFSQVLVEIKKSYQDKYRPKYQEELKDIAKSFKDKNNMDERDVLSDNDKDRIVENIMLEMYITLKEMMKML